MGAGASCSIMTDDTVTTHDSPRSPANTIDPISGLLCIQIVEAKDLPAMDLNGKSDPFVELVFGKEKVYKSKIIKKNLNPTWNETYKMLVAHSETGWQLEVHVWDYDRGKHNDYIGCCYIDVSLLFDGKVHDNWIDLHRGKKTKGQIHLICQMLNQHEVEKRFWESFAQYYDTTGDGALNRFEFTSLLGSISASFTEDEIASLYEKADANKDGSLSYDEVWNIIDRQRDISKGLFRDDPNIIWHIYARADEFNNVGSLILQKNLSASPKSPKEQHKVIMVQDRATGKLVEEKVPGYIEIALRIMYSSSSGRFAVNNHDVKKLLRHLSCSQGKKYDDPRSKKDIASFVKFHNLNLDEIREPLDSYKNFNEFFYRKLKPDARPIAFHGDPKVAVSPADCRMNAFPTVDEATKLWIKGRNFTLYNLLLSDELVAKYVGGSLIVARLAPQDYHRFHFPVDGVVGESTPIDGCLYTVNPVAVRQPIDVFTENKRIRTIIHSKYFGDVVYISIGATMVGSIVLTSHQGQEVNKGDEHGYFAFGGSTVLLLFPPGSIRLDADLVVNSAKPVETLVRMGDSIGVSLL